MLQIFPFLHDSADGIHSDASEIRSDRIGNSKNMLVFLIELRSDDRKPIPIVLKAIWSMC